jgi:DNA-nicking Smr family endonuclease
MNEGVRTVDLHGMTVYQAQICIDAELRRAKGLYRLRLIHGYRGGTALREMIRSRYAKRAGVLRVELGMNPGETDLVLREY